MIPGAPSSWVDENIEGSDRLSGVVGKDSQSFGSGNYSVVASHGHDFDIVLWPMLDSGTQHVPCPGPVTLFSSIEKKDCNLCRPAIRCRASARNGGFRLAFSVRAIYSRLVDPIKVELEKDWLSVADICDYMGVSPFVVTSQLRAGRLPAVKFGREWRVARGDFEDWINAQRGRPESSPPNPASPAEVTRDEGRFVDR